MPTMIKKLTDCNVYLDGTSFLGKAAEVNLPDLKFTMAPHGALGMFGKLDLPTGLDAMEATIKMNGLYKEFQAILADPYTARTLVVYGNQETWSGTGRIAQEQVVLTLMGTPKGAPLGNFKQHEPVDATGTFAITAAKLEIAGAVAFDIDVMNNIFKVDGADLLETYRANLAI